MSSQENRLSWINTCRQGIAAIQKERQESREFESAEKTNEYLTRILNQCRQVRSPVGAP